MASIVNIAGFELFKKFAETIDENGPPVYMYFTGSKLTDGSSWCPDCNDSDPVVKAFLEELKTSIIFAYVDVGDRDYWKDKACPFRTDPRTHLMVIPTIIKWNGVQRLEGSQCNKLELLQLMLEDED